MTGQGGAGDTGKMLKGTPSCINILLDAMGSCHGELPWRSKEGLSILSRGVGMIAVLFWGIPASAFWRGGAGGGACREG